MQRPEWFTDLPRFEPLKLTEQSVVDERRNRTMSQREETVAARQPAGLIRRTAGCRHDQLHLVSGREVDRARIGDEESIRDERHAPAWCKIATRVFCSTSRERTSGACSFFG